MTTNTSIMLPMCCSDQVYTYMPRYTTLLQNLTGIETKTKTKQMKPLKWAPTAIGQRTISNDVAVAASSAYAPVKLALVPW